MLVQNYETTEHQIKRVFETYGPIKRVSVFLLLGASAIAFNIGKDI